MKLLNKLERRFGRFAIENFMMVICMGQLLAFVADVFTNGMIGGMLWLDWSAVMRGEVWRLITFIFSPEATSSLISFLLSLYFYYMIGGALENEWGSFRFNVYYLIGMLGSWLAMLLTGYGTNTFLNLSLFFAFAIFYPNYEFLLFFILPVKVKWLAWANAALYLYIFISTPFWSTRASIVVSLINVFLFFGPTLLRHIRQQLSYRKTRQNFRRQMRQWNDR